MASAETFAIGISFGNSTSSIAYTSGVCFPIEEAHCRARLATCTDIRRACRKEKQKSLPMRKEVHWSQAFLSESSPWLIWLFRPADTLDIILHRGRRVSWHSSKVTASAQSPEHRRILSRLCWQRVRSSFRSTPTHQI